MAATPDVSSILAAAQPQQQAAIAAPQAVQAQAPPQQSLWKQLVTGALAGVSGSLQDPQNPAAGGAAVEQQALNAPKIAAQQQAAQQNAQNQQQFQNQMAAQKAQGQAQLQAAQTAHANLQGYQTALAIQHEPQEIQDKYNKSQLALIKGFKDIGMPMLGEVEDSPEAIQAYMQQTGRTADNTMFLHNPADNKVMAFPTTASTGQSFKGSQVNAMAKAAGIAGPQLPADADVDPKTFFSMFSKLQADKVQADALARKQAQKASAAAGANGPAPTGNSIHDTAERYIKGLETKASIAGGSRVGAQRWNQVHDDIVKNHPDFDIAGNESDYHKSTQVSTINNLNYLTSLTGRDGKSGNIGEIIKASDALPRTSLPALNDAQAWSSIQSGHPEYAAYRSKLLEVSDQIAKVLQGGSGGAGTSDAKLKQANEMLNSNFNPAQLKGVLQGLQPLLENRRQGMMQGQGGKPNVHLTKVYGDNTTQKPQLDTGHKIGDSVTLKNGKTVKITAIHSDGKFDAE